jgi:toxin-antitoxin system PIN domain toxin
MFAVDTNILLYAVDRDSAEHRPCRHLLDKCVGRKQPWALTWGILYEFLRVATHRNVFRKPLTLSQALTFVEPLLESPGLHLLEESPRHFRLLQELEQSAKGLAGNLLFDVRTAVLMKEHGYQRIYTYDADFRRFPEFKVMDPSSDPLD